MMESQEEGADNPIVDRKQKEKWSGGPIASFSNNPVN